MLMPNGRIQTKKTLKNGWILKWQNMVGVED